MPSAGLSAPRGIAVTAEEFAEVDPCAFVDTRSLGELGTVEVAQGRIFPECEVRVRKGNYTGSFRYTKVNELTNYTAPPATSDHGGVTVYNYAAPENAGCKREIEVADRAFVEIWLSEEPSEPTCRNADAAVDGTLRELGRGNLPSAGLPANSLANQDACGLVDRELADRVPGIDKGQVKASYGGQGCTWGVESVTEPNLYVAFSREEAPAVDRPVEREITVVGRRAVVTPRPANEHSEWLGPSKANCAVAVEHRVSEVPGKVEVLAVVVAADAPEASLCPLAIEIATQAAGRLPQG